MTALTCPNCGGAKEPELPPFGEPPTDGSAPLLAAACGCGVIFMYRILADGPELVPITPERMTNLLTQEWFRQMMQAVTEHQRQRREEPQ